MYSSSRLPAFGNCLTAVEIWKKSWPLQKKQKQARYPLTAVQQGMYVQSVLDPDGYAYHMPGAFRMEKKPDVAALEAAFATLIAQDAIFRTVFRRPFKGHRSFLPRGFNKARRAVLFKSTCSLHGKSDAIDEPYRRFRAFCDGYFRRFCRHEFRLRRHHRFPPCRLR